MTKNIHFYHSVQFYIYAAISYSHLHHCHIQMPEEAFRQGGVHVDRSSAARCIRYPAPMAIQKSATGSLSYPSNPSLDFLPFLFSSTLSNLTCSAKKKSSRTCPALRCTIPPCPFASTPSRIRHPCPAGDTDLTYNFRAAGTRAAGDQREGR